MDANSFSPYEAVKAFSAERKMQEKALEWLYRFQVPSYKRYFLFKGLSKSQSEDLTQVVVIKIFTHANEFRGNENFSDASAKSWMWTIVRTSLIDFVRREQKHKREISGLNHESEMHDLSMVGLAEEKFLGGLARYVEDKSENLTDVRNNENGEWSGCDTDAAFQLNEIDVSAKENTQLGSENNFYAQRSEFLESEQPDIKSQLKCIAPRKEGTPPTTNSMTSKTKAQYEIEHEERTRQIRIEECVAQGIEEFSANEPERADALLMQIDGIPIKQIAHYLKRTETATKEYLSQCKKKLKPFVSTCFDLLQPN